MDEPYVNTSYPMSVAGINELRFVRSGPSNVHRCRAFPFALAGLYLFVTNYWNLELSRQNLC